MTFNEAAELLKSNQSIIGKKSSDGREITHVIISNNAEAAIDLFKKIYFGMDYTVNITIGDFYVYVAYDLFEEFKATGHIFIDELNHALAKIQG